MKKVSYKYTSFFSGIGGFDKPLNDLGGECVLASEIDPFAEQGYQALFGHGTAGDITKIAEEDVPDHDLLAGGFPCFIQGTLITTDKGLKEIEEIRAGDMVLTHTNEFKRVVVPMVKNKKGIYRLQVQGSPVTYVTEEHPYYVREMVRKYDREQKKVKRVWTEPKWVEAKDLKPREHFVGMSENTRELNERDLTKEEAWLLGRYAADGYIQDSLRSGRKNSYNRKTIFCLGKNKVQEFMEAVNGAYHVTLSENETVFKAIITSERLMELSREIGRGSANKQVPGFIMDLPKELLERFLDGYMSGDGCVQEDKYYASTVSKKLVYGLGTVVQKLYSTPYTIKYSKKPDKTKIMGREVNQRDSWQIQFRKQTKKQQDGKYIEGMLWMPVRKLEYDENFEGEVYNFEVADDNSYVANNLTVHNCQSFSQSGLRLGFEDTRGTLFFEIERIAKEKQPKVLLLENVKGLVNHDDGNTINVIVNRLNAIGYRVDFKVINSRYFGVPQSRDRIFFVAVREDLVENRGWIIRGNTVTPTAKRMLYKNKGLKTFNFPFPEGVPTKLTIKDIMEDHVDEKYYVTKESAVKLLEELSEKANKETKPKKSTRRRTLFQKPVEVREIEVEGSLDQAGFESVNRVYGVEGLAPTVVTRGACYILEEDPEIKVVGRVHKGMSGIVVSSEGVSPTMTTKGTCMVIENPEENKIDVVGSIEETQRGRVYNENGIVGALMATDYKSAKTIIEQQDTKPRIRRLTPKEYLRLQAFPEGTYETLRAAGVSDSQIYKQAGNAVTLTVIEALVKQIIKEGYLD